MRSRRLIGAGVAAMALLAGCGIPASSGVRDEGPGQPGRAGGQEAGLQPPSRLANKEPNQFILNFLSAPAGDFDGAVKRQKLFMTQQAQSDWRPPQGINVISLTEAPLFTATTGEVRLKNVQHIGVLDDQGILEPPSPQETTTEYRFHVGFGDDETSGLYVSKPPQVILMTLDALDYYYQPRTLYFWDTDHTGLVPDVRYLATSVPPAQRPDDVLEWLIRGPSPWLEAAVESLPGGTQAPGNVPDPRSGGHLVVNLNAAALTGNADQQERLGSQLRWSLRPDWKGDLELKIDNQHKATFRGDGYLADNPATRDEADPLPFCVYQGHVRRLSPPTEPTDVPLDDKVNRDVRLAALARTGNGDQLLGALVRSARDGLELWVGGGAPAAYKRIGSARTMSRPAWIAGGGGTGLVAADGKLYHFTREGMRRLRLTGSAGSVTAVATPADGRRVAYVAGGRLYVAALVRDNEKLTRVDTARQIPTPFSKVTAVAWSGEGKLVIAGSRSDDGRTALFELGVDGAQRLPTVEDLGEATVDHLVAYQDDPARSGEDRRIMYEDGNRSFELLYLQPQELKAAAVLGLQPTPQKPAESPLAPFFLD
jgi:hypothetical protein